MGGGGMVEGVVTSTCLCACMCVGERTPGRNQFFFLYERFRNQTQVLRLLGCAFTAEPSLA